MKKFLHSSEWTFVLVVLILVVSLIITAKIKAFQAASVVRDADLVVENVTVAIKGAVKKEGLFLVVPGTSLRQVLKKAKPLPFADLQKLPLDLPVDEAMELVVEELKEIEVKVCGEAEEMLLKLPIGSRVCDLKERVKLKKGADKSVFRGNRKLKNGEVVEVKKKPIEVNYPL